MTPAREVPQDVHDLTPLDLQAQLLVSHLGGFVHEVISDGDGLGDLVVADEGGLESVSDLAGEDSGRTAGGVGIVRFLEEDGEGVLGRVHAFRKGVGQEAAAEVQIGFWNGMKRGLHLLTKIALA